MFWKGNHTFAGVLSATTAKITGILGLGKVTMAIQSTEALPADVSSKRLFVANDGVVKSVDQSGIVRPSTYSPQISAITPTCVKKWTAIASADDGAHWQSTVWSPKLNLFVMVGYNSTINSIMTSPDGITWTLRASPINGAVWQSLCWAPEANSGNGMFVAVGYLGGVGMAMYSTNGTTWLSGTLNGNTPLSVWKAVAWSAELGLFSALATDRAMWSTDGISWTEGTTITTSFGCYSMTYGHSVNYGDKFIGMPYGGEKPLISTDGKNYTQSGVTMPHIGLANWMGVCYSSELSTYVAVAFSHSGAGHRVVTSIDGLNWFENSLSYSMDTSAWHGICWASEISSFIAVAYNSSSLPDIGWSQDGVVWQKRTSSKPDSGWFSVCWSPELSLSIAAGGQNSATTLRVLRSL
jgi:hypothetical protein